MSEDSDVSSTELSEILGVGPRHLSKLAQAGIIVKAGSGRYLLRAGCKGYIAHLKHYLDGRLTDEIKRERLEREKLKRLREERDFLKSLGKLVNAADMQREVEKNNGRIAAKFHNLPTLAGSLEGLVVHEIRCALEQYADDSLRELSGIDAEAIVKGQGEREKAAPRRKAKKVKAAVKAKRPKKLR